jgi:hypothetical protein
MHEMKSNILLIVGDDIGLLSAHQECSLTETEDLRRATQKVAVGINERTLCTIPAVSLNTRALPPDLPTLFPLFRTTGH